MIDPGHGCLTGAQAVNEVLRLGAKRFYEFHLRKKDVATALIELRR